MILRWCWRCRRDVPMLDEVEYAELAVVLDACLGSIKREREARAVGLEQIEVRSHYAPALRLYQELTGVAASDPEELRHHQNALLGHDCRACGRALRTLDARSCVECGEPFDPRAEVSKRAHRDGLRRELMRTLTNLAAPGPRALAAMPE